MDYVDDDLMYRCADCARELPRDEVVTLVKKDDLIRGICGRCWAKRSLAARN